MIGKIFITRSGYDPQVGKHVKDPYLGDSPSLGACRPDIRRVVTRGDYIFTISGKVPNVPQYVMGGFRVDAKLPARVAHKLLPEQRLRRRPDGQLDGNIIVNARGKQHALDDHNHFDRRIENYVVGSDCVALNTPEEIERGRAETLEALQEILKKKGLTPIQVVGRWGTGMNEEQALDLVKWLRSLKNRARAGAK